MALAYFRIARINSLSLFTIAWTSACVGGSLSATLRFDTPLVLLEVPSMAVVSVPLDTSQGGR